MSIATLIIGPSGTGKSSSLRGLDPTQTMLVQCISKPLPFSNKGWTVHRGKEHPGNIVRTDDPAQIMRMMASTRRPVIVIDDFQAVLVNQLMAKIEVKGYEKFTEIAKSAWQIFQMAGDLAEDKRIYIIGHSQSDDVGNIRMKTVGKMVDQVLTPEGYFTIVLRTTVVNGNYKFVTTSNGLDCCKSPFEMFSDEHIDNDLGAVDARICEFYDINQQIQEAA